MNWVIYAAKIRKIIPVFRDSLARFRKNDPLRLASSTAFFTIFSLPPILIILINLLGSIFSKEIVSGEFFQELIEIFGKDTARQVQDIFYNLQQREGNLAFSILGGVFLCFVATTLFVVVQHSINELWNIRLKESSKRKHFALMLKHRITSLGIILCAGLLVLSSLISDAALAFLGHYLEKIVPQFYLEMLHWGSHIISSLVAMVWFAILFKYLPDARTEWRIIWVGASVTAILFEFGKMLLGKLLVNSGLTSIYGTAGSLILLLLFIFYSSMILFYGASFTKVYAEFKGIDIEPKAYAMAYEIKEKSKI